MAKKEFDYVWTDKKRTIFGLPLSFTRYFLTETKFITRTGFLSITEDELDLYKVTDKKLVLSLGQRMFGCGSVIIYVKDTDTPVKEVRSIKSPRKLSDLIDKYVDMQKDKYRIKGRDMMGSYAEECDGDCNSYDE